MLILRVYTNYSNWVHFFSEPLYINYKKNRKSESVSIKVVRNITNGSRAAEPKRSTQLLIPRNNVNNMHKIM